MARVQFPKVTENCNGFFLAARTHLEGGPIPPSHHMSPLKGYEEYEAIQLPLPSGAPNDQNSLGVLVNSFSLLSHSFCELSK